MRRDRRGRQGGRGGGARQRLITLVFPLLCVCIYVSVLCNCELCVLNTPLLLLCLTLYNIHCLVTDAEQSMSFRCDGPLPPSAIVNFNFWIVIHRARVSMKSNARKLLFRSWNWLYPGAEQLAIDGQGWAQFGWNKMKRKTLDTIVMFVFVCINYIYVLKYI